MEMEIIHHLTRSALVMTLPSTCLIGEAVSATRVTLFVQKKITPKLSRKMRHLLVMFRWDLQKH